MELCIRPCKRVNDNALNLQSRNMRFEVVATILWCGWRDVPWAVFLRMGHAKRCSPLWVDSSNIGGNLGNISNLCSGTIIAYEDVLRTNSATNTAIGPPNHLRISLSPEAAKSCRANTLARVVYLISPSQNYVF